MSDGEAGAELSTVMKRSLANTNELCLCLSWSGPGGCGFMIEFQECLVTHPSNFLLKIASDCLTSVLEELSVHITYTVEQIKMLHLPLLL